MNPLKKAHDQNGFQIKSMQKYLESYPELNKEIQANLEKYGTPFHSSSYGGRWKEDIPGDVHKLMYQELPDQLIEITIKPEDPDGHHWQIEYHILTPDEKGNLVRASELGRKR